MVPRYLPNFETITDFVLCQMMNNIVSQAHAIYRKVTKILKKCYLTLSIPGPRLVLILLQAYLKQINNKN